MCTEQLPPGGYPIAVKYIILSGACQLQRRPLVCRGSVVVAALLPPRSCGGPGAAAAAVDRLLMMGIRMPETC